MQMINDIIDIESIMTKEDDAVALERLKAGLDSYYFYKKKLNFYNMNCVLLSLTETKCVNCVYQFPNMDCFIDVSNGAITKVVR